MHYNVKTQYVVWRECGEDFDKQQFAVSVSYGNIPKYGNNVRNLFGIEYED